MTTWATSTTLDKYLEMIDDTNTGIIERIKKLRAAGDIQIQRNGMLYPDLKQKVKNEIKKINWGKLNSGDEDFITRTEIWLGN